MWKKELQTEGKLRESFGPGDPQSRGCPFEDMGRNDQAPVPCWAGLLAGPDHGMKAVVHPEGHP